MPPTTFRGQCVTSGRVTTGPKNMRELLLVMWSGSRIPFLATYSQQLDLYRAPELPGLVTAAGSNPPRLRSPFPGAHGSLRKEFLPAPVQAGWCPPGGRLYCPYSHWILPTLSQKSFPSREFSPVCRYSPCGERVMRGWTAVTSRPLLMPLGCASLLPEGPSGI